MEAQILINRRKVGMELKHTSNLDKGTIKKLLQLDYLTYPIEQQGDIVSVLERFERNNDTYSVVLNNEEPIGYLCAFPIVDELYLEIKKGNFLKDKEINPEQVVDFQIGNTYNLYIISIVIHPDFQGTEVLKYLLNGFVDRIEALQGKGVKFNRILAQGISEKGKDLLQSMGFKTVNSLHLGTTVMENTVEDVICKIKERLISWNRS
jgi:hypothetical protein